MKLVLIVQSQTLQIVKLNLVGFFVYLVSYHYWIVTSVPALFFAHVLVWHKQSLAAGELQAQCCTKQLPCDKVVY